MMTVRYEIRSDNTKLYTEISLVGACTRAKESSRGSRGATITVSRVEAGRAEVIEARYSTVNGKTESWIR